MELWLVVLFWSLIGSVVSLIAGFLLLAKKISLSVIQTYAVPFAAGSLLAASFLDLLPEAFESGEAKAIAVAALSGFLIFFVLERFLGWFHHHHDHEGKEQLHPTVKLLIVGDTLHNFLDGLVIGAAFLIDVPTGIIVTLAVASHEIPQEVGDFGIMLAHGMRRKNVLLVNFVSALATVVAALTVVMFGGFLASYEPYLLAIAAGFFIYIAASDIIPAIHEQPQVRTANIQTFVVIIGIVIIGALIDVAHGYIEPAHDDDHHTAEQH